MSTKQRELAIAVAVCWSSALVLLMLALASCSPSSASSELGAQPPTAVVSVTAIPTQAVTSSYPPRPTALPTVAPKCFRWDTVGLDDVGRNLCMYGRVVSTSTAGGESLVLDFGQAPGGGRGTVMVLYTVAGYVWNEVDYIVGQCLVTSGEVQDLGGYAGVGITVGGAPRSVVRMDDPWCDHPVQYYDPTGISSDDS